MPNYRSVQTPYGEFESIKDAAEFCGTSRTMMFHKLNSKNEKYDDYYYLEPKEGDEERKERLFMEYEHSRRPNTPKGGPMRRKPTVTPIGTFDSLKEAAEAHGVTIKTLGSRVRGDNPEYYYIDTGPTYRQLKAILKEAGVKHRAKIPKVELLELLEVHKLANSPKQTKPSKPSKKWWKFWRKQ